MRKNQILDAERIYWPSQNIKSCFMSFLSRVQSYIESRYKMWNLGIFLSLTACMQRWKFGPDKYKK